MRQKRNGDLPHQIKTRNVVLYCIVVVILSAVALMSGKLSRQHSGTAVTVSDAAFQVHVLDVGQGDSILVLADGEAMLIDAGQTQAAPDILNYLHAQNVTALTCAAATHLHFDHIGGFPAVLAQIPAAQLIGSPCPDDLLPDDPTYAAYLGAVEESGAEYSVLQAGGRFRVGGASVEVLAPASAEAENLNNTSLVLKITYGDAVCLLAGDMEQAEEEILLAGNPELKADFLKVGFHGDAAASGADFLEQVRPEFAAISCGKDNPYGHPAQQTLERLSAYTDEVYVTAEVGNVVFLYDGTDMRIVTGNGAE